MLTAVGQEQFICQERLPGGSYRIHSEELGNLGITKSGTQLVNLLASLPLINKTQATEWVGTLESAVKESAKQEVKPLMYGAIAIGGIGALMGLTAFIVAMRRR